MDMQGMDFKETMRIQGSYEGRSVTTVYGREVVICTPIEVRAIARHRGTGEGRIVDAIISLTEDSLYTRVLVLVRTALSPEWELEKFEVLKNPTDVSCVA